MLLNCLNLYQSAASDSFVTNRNAMLVSALLPTTTQIELNRHSIRFALVN